MAFGRAGEESRLRQVALSSHRLPVFSGELKTFEDFAAFKNASFNLTGSGAPGRLNGLRPSAGFFPVLSASPALGRAFTDPGTALATNTK